MAERFRSRVERLAERLAERYMLMAERYSVTCNATQRLAILVVERTRGIGIVAQLEMSLPVESGPSPGQFIITVPRSGNAQSDICGVSRESSVRSQDSPRPTSM